MHSHLSPPSLETQAPRAALSGGVRVVAATVAFASVFAFSFAICVPDAEAKYSNRDLRKAGYTGLYRGTAKGGTGTWNGVDYTGVVVNQSTRQRVPIKNTMVVTTTGGSAFSLRTRRISGNIQRRIKVIQNYSGNAFNTFYGENMVGSGKKVVVIRKKGKGRRATFQMTFTDKIQERAAVGGALYTFWNVKGRLQKR